MENWSYLSYLDDIYLVLNNIYSLLVDLKLFLETNVSNILIAICFFGLCMVSFRFLHVRSTDIR